MSNRLKYVASATDVFVRMMLNQITIDDLENFAAIAERVAHEKSQMMTKELGDDEMELTNHAAHMRTVSAKIVLLRDGLIPAMKIDRENIVFHKLAVEQMAFIRAECEAMTGLMR